MYLSNIGSNLFSIWRDILKEAGSTEQEAMANQAAVLEQYEPIEPYHPEPPDRQILDELYEMLRKAQDSKWFLLGLRKRALALSETIQDRANWLDKASPSLLAWLAGDRPKPKEPEYIPF